MPFQYKYVCDYLVDGAPTDSPAGKAQQTIGAAPKPDPKSRLHLVENTTVAIPAPIQKLKKPEMDMVASKTMARIQQQPDFTKKFERPVPRTTAISFRWL